MSIADNINRVAESIATACAKVNRDPQEVTLVAVSKQKSVADIVEAAAAGMQHFGENRVEEAILKIEQVNQRVGNPICWHMVGHVQSRKAKHVAPLFDVIQSVDSLRLATRFSRVLEHDQRETKVMLEINVSGEASKYGFEGYNWYCDVAIKDKLWQEIGAAVALPNLRVIGLMAMAPFRADSAIVRKVFADLFALRHALADSLAISLPELSMGMTDDYQIAIEEGATIVRIGRAIFGERKAQSN